jgi:chaperone modulatory protein CbpM
MKLQPHDWNWLDASETIGLSELSRACQVSVGEIDELIEYGALVPLQREADELVFSAACAPALRTACKLRQDYDLDLFTVALLMDYLNRIEHLEREIRSLHAHLPAHVVAARREGPQPWREPHAGGAQRGS